MCRSLYPTASDGRLEQANVTVRLRVLKNASFIKLLILIPFYMFVFIKKFGFACASCVFLSYC